MMLTVAGCGIVDDPSSQTSAGVSASVATDQLVRRLDAFIDQADRLIADMQHLRGQAGWDGLVQTVRSVQAREAGADRPPGGRRPVAWDAVVAVLNEQSRRTGDDRYAVLRDLLDRSSELEWDRQRLLKDWKNAAEEAQRAIPQSQYAVKQLEAIRSDTRLYFEMNQSVLDRYRLNELGLMTMVMPMALGGSVQDRPSSLARRNGL